MPAVSLKLIETAEIVQFPKACTFEEGWNARQGMMKKRGDGKDKTRKLWQRHAKKVGSAALLGALKRYLREEKEPTCGYPGLSVWLNGERYDHWMPSEFTDQEGGQPRNQAPEPQRSRLPESGGR